MNSLTNTKVMLGGAAFLSLAWLYKKSRKSTIHKKFVNTFFLIDDDIDGTSSVLAQIASTQNTAFTKPTIFCDLIDKVPEDQEIRIVLNTNGGSLIHCSKMLRKLKKHKAGYIAYIKNNCYSAGTIIALGAKEIVFYKDSMLGKIDPQTGDGQQMMIYHNLQDKYVNADTIYHVEEANYIYNYMN